MSYCRFGWGGSDVYIFGTSLRKGTEGVNALECCGCCIDDRWHYFTYGEMLNHIAAHRRAGDHVPDEVLERMYEEIEGGPEEQWVPVGELPDRATFPPNQDPDKPTPEPFASYEKMRYEP